MGATSVTGKGTGSSEKYTTKQLAILANGPTIFIAAYAESLEIPDLSPTSFGATVLFPIPFLTGPSTNYVVHITTINGGKAYVTNMRETNGIFVGFDFQTESVCSAMYSVMDVGIKPAVEPT
jgi:hypothetical protein